MGCWNETCLISNLPIRVGNPVVAYFVAHDNYKDVKDYSGDYHATDRVFPISLPIEAEYDDYGSIENFDGKSLAIRHIKKLFDSRSIDNVFTRLHDNNLTIPSVIGNGNIGVGMVMFHKQLYEAAINKIATVNIEEIKQRAASSIEFRVSMGELKKNAKLFKKYGLDPLPASINDIASCSVDQGKKDGFALRVVEEIVIEDIKNHPEKKKSILDDFSSKMAERVIITAALNKLRKTWIPPQGKGSQSDEVYAHIILANEIKKVALADREIDELYRIFLEKE